MDPLACNYNPEANFNIQSICCYPGSCDDRNLNVVCPSISSGRFAITELFPNPSKGMFTIRLLSDLETELNCEVYNSIGQLVLTPSIGNVSGTTEMPIDISTLGKGIYRLKISSRYAFDSRTFIVSE